MKHRGASKSDFFLLTMMPEVSKSNRPTNPQSVGKPARWAIWYTVLLAIEFFGKPHRGWSFLLISSVGPVSIVLDITPTGLWTRKLLYAYPAIGRMISIISDIDEVSHRSVEIQTSWCQRGILSTKSREDVSFDHLRRWWRTYRWTQLLHQRTPP